MQRLLSKSFIILSFIGILDAGYIAVKSFTGGTVTCPLVGGCSDVLQSPYSQLFGYPVALYGVIFYVIVFVLAFLYLDREHPLVYKALSIMPLFGFLFTLYFLYLQAFVIEKYCFYCLVSATLSTVMFLMTLWFNVLKRRTENT